MDMVLVWDMLVWDIEVLAMLDTDMVLDLMDTLDLDIMARDPLMLNPRLRLMLDFFMEDMDMVLVWDMLVWDIVDLDITARDPLMLSLKPRLMLVFCMEDMD